MRNSNYRCLLPAGTIGLLMLIITMLPSVHVHAQPGTSNKISEKVAKDWRNHWKDFVDVLSSKNQKRKPQVIDSLQRLQAFLIPMEDIKQFIREAESSTVPVIGIRLYLGLGNIDTTRQKEIKLIMVGVNDLGDMIGKASGEQQDFIFDLTSPCPNTCDQKSPLYFPENVQPPLKK